MREENEDSSKTSQVVGPLKWMAPGTRDLDIFDIF